MDPRPLVAGTGRGDNSSCWARHSGTRERADAAVRRLALCVDLFLVVAGGDLADRGAPRPRDRQQPRTPRGSGHGHGSVLSLAGEDDKTKLSNGLSDYEVKRKRAVGCEEVSARAQQLWLLVDRAATWPTSNPRSSATTLVG